MTIPRHPVPFRKARGYVDKLHRGFVRTMFGFSVLCLAYTGYYGFRVFVLGIDSPPAPAALEAPASPSKDAKAAPVS